MEATEVTVHPQSSTFRRAPVRSEKLTVVTDSELQTFRACPQLHDFKYRQRLRPLVDAKPLAVGSIVHAGMSAGLRAGFAPVVGPGELGDHANRALATVTSIQGWVDRQVAAATKGIDDLVMVWAGKIVEHSTTVDFEALSAEVDETAKMVKWMLGHYFDVTRGDLSSLELVETETAFDVPMRDRAGREVRHLRYTGVRDAVYYDPTYNALVLDEHKTSGGDPKSIEKRVEMDTQTAGYLHALNEQLHAPGAVMRTTTGRVVPLDASIGRVRYNVLRKNYPEPPKVNKDGTVSVAQCATTPEMYRAALDAQVVERKKPVTEKQEAFLFALEMKGDPFFARVEWYRGAEDIERWRSDTFVDASRIREANRDATRRTRSVGHCNMPWSLPCRYRSVCLDRNSPELLAQFRVIDDVHSEVRAAEVDATAAAES